MKIMFLKSNNKSYHFSKDAILGSVAKFSKKSILV